MSSIQSSNIFQVSEKIKSNIGVRADSQPEISSKEWTLSPRLGLSYSFANDTIVKASFGQYYKSPDEMSLIEETDKLKKMISRLENKISASIKTSSTIMELIEKFSGKT